MGTLETMLGYLRGKRVYFDTNPFIYFIEKHDEFFEAVKPIFQMLKDDEFTAYTSDFTLTETLIKPYKDNDQATIDLFRSLLLDTGYFSMLSISQETFLNAAKVGGETMMRTPDAIHMASAVENQCDYFITNDKRIRDYKSVKVLQVSDFLP